MDGALWLSMLVHHTMSLGVRPKVIYQGHFPILPCVFPPPVICSSLLDCLKISYKSPQNIFEKQGQQFGG